MRKRLLAGFLTAVMMMYMPVTVKAEEEASAPAGVESAGSAVNEEAEGTVESIIGLPEGEVTDGAAVELPEIQEQGTSDDEIGHDDSRPEEENQLPELSYEVHVQTHGWQEVKHAGEISGTTGQAKRLEAIKLSVDGAEYEGGIEYCTHVQSYGWQDWVSDGELSGTEGQAKRLEAIQIRLTGELKEHYDVYYQVHAQSYGWLNWACNGEKAGTASYAKRLESIVIVLVEKGGQPPESTVGTKEKAYYAPQIQYQTHVQTYGWQSKVSDGALSGTTGQAKRLEGIRINLYDTSDLGYEGGIEYCTHVQSYGWQDWVSNGVMSGTTGQAKRLEAIRIRLTGELKEHYDVYYRVHCQTKDWMGWAKNGEPAGSEGYAKRLEAIEIRLVENTNSADAPDTSSQAYIALIPEEDVSLFGRIWTNSSYNTDADDDAESEIQVKGNGQILGDPAGDAVLTAFGMNLNSDNKTIPHGEIQYRVDAGGNWTGWVSQGTAAEGRNLAAIQIKLTGELSKFYDVYYRSCVEKYGWLGWIYNGGFSGIRDSEYAMKAIQVRLVAKNQKGPSADRSPYIGKSGAGILANPCPKASYISSEFGGREAPTAGASTNHKGRDYAAVYGTPILAATTGTVRLVSSNWARGNYLILDHGQGLFTLYQHCSRINVKAGDTVFVGTKIAEVGSTGISTGPHLHFEVWVNEIPVDPRWYL